MAKRTAHRLTDKDLRGFRQPGRYYDGLGLFLIVDPSGRKRWGLRLEHAGKRHELGGIGVYDPSDPNHASLAVARERARALRVEWMGKVSAGAHITGSRAGPRTFRAYAERFIAARRAGWKNPVHAQQWPSSLSSYAYPVIGERPISDVTPTEVRAILEPIWHSKPETARRIRQRLNAIFDAAIAEEVRVKANPCAGLTKLLGAQRGGVVHHEALDWREMPEFIVWLRCESPNSSVVRLAFEFLILTATRVRETLDSTWDEFELEAGLWRIPRARMKRADHADKPHEIPLSDRACEILRHARETNSHNGPLVFPAARGEALMTDTLRMCLRRGGYSVTAHGFRSSFRDWAAERWASPIADKSAVIEAALDHVPGRVERAYHRSRYLEERRALMQSWCDSVSAHVTQD